METCAILGQKEGEKYQKTLEHMTVSLCVDYQKKSIPN